MRRRGTSDDVRRHPLVDAMALPVILLSAEREVVAINRPALSLLGLPDACDVIGQGLHSMLCPESAAAVLAHLTAIETGTSPLDIAVARLRGAETAHLFQVTVLDMGRDPLQGYVLQSLDAALRSADLDYASVLPENLPHRRWELDLFSGEIRSKHGTIKLAAATADHLSRFFGDIHPDDLTRVKCGLASVISTVEDHFRMTYRLRTGGDQDKVFHAAGHVSDWSCGGLPQKLLVDEYDVTDIAEGPDDGVGGGEHRWKTAVLSANQAVWDHDFENNRHYLSKTWRDLRGLSVNDYVPQNTEEWLTTVHEQDVGHLIEEWRRIDAGETDIINYKFRQRHKDGHWVWFLSRGRVVRRDPAGLPVRIIGTDTDITDIKTVELESQRMAQRLHVAMEAAGMARWEFNITTKEAYWDDRLLKMFAVKDGNNIRSGDDWARYIHPDDREDVVAYTDDRLVRKQDIAHDYRVLTGDGEVKHIRARAKYVEDTEAEPRYYGVNFDITRDKLQTQELEKARALLEHESRHDAMTGLANRRKLDETYSQYARNSSERVAVLHFDIDHFKHINDTLGHDAGDATLKHAAAVLMRNTPASALVSRVGGDEFVALLFDAPDDTALASIAEAIIREMSQPFYYGSQECNIGTSIGVATTNNPNDAGSDLFINADLALYEAKKAGRGRYRFFSSSMKDEARRRKKSFDALSAGFEKGEITCHYQPQFDAVTLEPTGLEALVRWESAKYGLIMPQDFLQTAEDMGLVAQFDELVLRRALHDIKTWQEAGLAVPPISVNVSAHRLNDPTLGDRLRVLDLPPGMLSFELLESAFLDSRNDIIDKNLQVIGSMGINIEIDDFGSGHASIASLLEIAPKRLKIDRFLIQPIVQSQRQRDLVRTIIGIGHMLGIKVVAEGVETDEHVRILQEMGCCFLQGFGLARPMDNTNTGRFLEQAAKGRFWRDSMRSRSR